VENIAKGAAVSGQMQFPVAIHGAGALGTFFACRLGQAGCRVTLIARGARLRALQVDGLRFSDARGAVRQPCAFSGNPSAAAKAELVILAVKSWQLEGALADLAPHLAPGTAVLTLQNGVDAPDIAARVLPRHPVLAGIVHGFFNLDHDGVVRHAGVAPRLIAGVHTGDGAAHLAQLRGALARTATHCDIVADIKTELWRKMMLACAVGGLGAAYDRPAGWLRTEARAELIALLEEAVEVARAAGAKLGEADVAATLAFIDSFPPDATTSMQRDIVTGRSSEFDAQNGALKRWARRLQVLTPVNERVLDLIGQRWDAYVSSEGAAT